jgi:hypothetical protein
MLWDDWRVRYAIVSHPANPSPTFITLLSASSTRLKGKSASMVIRQSGTFPTHSRTSGRSVPGTNNEER